MRRFLGVYVWDDDGRVRSCRRRFGRDCLDGGCDENWENREKV